MFEILDMVHSILEEQKITAEEQLQLNKICDLEDKFVKSFSKDKWKEYFDAPLGIWAATEDGVFHNTVTPIARFLPDNRYCIELILRNNLTTEQYPDGVFHAHPEYHTMIPGNTLLMIF